MTIKRGSLRDMVTSLYSLALTNSSIGCITFGSVIKTFQHCTLIEMLVSLCQPFAL